ncbi:MAG: glycoside hydrolase family 9 protein [Defluviitaleaceae bacterium]|nr:glycoside hydrolase family 9 protein [Defluviitaleaceae bacterium]MCL2239774.1 glycoside hydrolase family 9 protein [Defluviitaleaceae bacterium]
MKSVHVNQLGYRPGDVKKAIIPAKSEGFCVLRMLDEESVFEGTAGGVVEYTPGGERVRVADFSSVAEKGRYVLCAGGKRSFPFTIQEHPYHALRAALLEFFHYQKCGTDLECGLWSHPACHTTLATVHGTDEKRDVSGGWHDAGDYGRYIVPAAKAVADLLLAHELSPNPDAHLPGVVWFELEWMLKMQDPSGGVHHKVSCHRFNALEAMPHEEQEELVIAPVSAVATAVFAAVTAMASRFYPDKARELLSAAGRAWDWCAANPDARPFKNPEDISTGGYGSTGDKDARFWAACELYVATGEKCFHDFLKAGEIYTGLGWSNVGTYGIAAYLYRARDASDLQLTARMKDALLTVCKKILHAYTTDPYGVSLGDDYRWGSNMIVANNAATFLLARPFTKQAIDLNQAALEHLHYLLGRNPLSQIYVTGFGENPPKQPHHRPSAAKGQPVPGMVVGGPNKLTHQDPALKAHCTGNPPAKSYVDHKHSFSSNEVTIYWNSALYFLIAVLGL